MNECAVVVNEQVGVAGAYMCVRLTLHTGVAHYLIMGRRDDWRNPGINRATSCLPVRRHTHERPSRGRSRPTDDIADHPNLMCLIPISNREVIVL